MIERARDEDREAMASLMAPFVERWRWDRAVEAVTPWVARSGGVVVGVALGSAASNGVSHLAALTVAADFRRRGIGRALVGQLARELGCTRLTTSHGHGSLLPGVHESWGREFFDALRFVEEAVQCTMRARLPPPSVGIAAADIAPATSPTPELHRLLDELDPSWRAFVDGAFAGTAPTRILVARLAGELAGFVLSTPGQPAAFGPVGVAAKFRRRGIGLQLAERALVELHAAGSVEVELWTGRDDFQAERFYPKLGFRVTDIWRNFSADAKTL
jgi:ribosomal protein S18 acetylase RimI-like enzyme